MPTSFPRSFPEVRFPYEFTALYDKPLSYFQDYSQGFVGKGVGAPFDGITDNTLYHRYKQDEMLRSVQGKILSESARRINQVTGQSNRQFTHQKLEANGELSGGVGGYPHSTGTIEGAPVLAGRGLCGGVMRTQAGKQFLQRRLTARIQELNRIGDLSQEFELPARDVNDYTEDDKDIMDVGEHLDAIVDVVNESAKMGSDLVKESRDYVLALKKIGWRFGQNQLTLMLREVQTAINAVGDYVGIRAGNGGFRGAESNRNAKVVLTNLKRGQKLIEYLTTKSTLSPKERKLALESYKVAGLSRTTKDDEAEGAGKPKKMKKVFAPTETVYSQKTPSWYRAPSRPKTPLEKRNPSGLV
jgi:hypothetical protein